MIALGCDHGGYELKQEIIKYLEEKNIPYKDFGCHSTEAVDYPIYARMVGKAIQTGECEKGILICGTGIGVCLAASKVKGERYPCSSLYRLFLCRSYKRAQRCQYFSAGRQSRRTGTCSKNRRYIFKYRIFSRRTPSETY